MDANEIRVPPQQLKRRFSVSEVRRLLLASSATQSLSSEVFLGGSQHRFFRSLEFGLSMPDGAHHVFVSGLQGVSVLGSVYRHAVRILLARADNDAPDWVYVFNRKDSHKPVAFSVPRGAGVRLRSAIHRLRDTLKEEVPRISTRVQDECSSLVSAGAQRDFEEMNKEIEALGFKYVVHPQQTGIMLIPLSGENGGVEPSEIDPAFVERQRQASDLGDRFLERRQKDLQSSAKTIREKLEVAIKELNENLFAGLRNALDNDLKIPVDGALDRFLNELRKHSIDGFIAFLDPKETSAMPPEVRMYMLTPWDVNVFVDNAACVGTPIVVEENPTYERLAGKTGYTYTQNGGFAPTDHTRIRAGSVAYANGGCLIVDMLDVLRHPGSFEFLLKILKNQRLEIENLWTAFGWGSMSDLMPQSIPLKLKVVACGSRALWSILTHHIPEFRNLFSVRADVLPALDTEEEELSAYALWLNRVAQDSGFNRVSPNALGKVLEYGLRLAEDQRRISTDSRDLSSIIAEAGHYARTRKKNQTMICANDVVKTLEARFWRSDYLYERLRSAIADGTILVSVAGRATGQINGLAVYLADTHFGLPTRITANAFPGPKSGFVSIQREAKLAGNIANKADLTIQMFLLSLYAPHAPVQLAVSMSFEQSYGMVDGDSASVAELIAILSAISGVPVKQSIAVTGSLNQKGEVQAIGGVNAKIEGHFDVCRAMGALSGEQGVIIPWQNKSNLMLRSDVVKAVEDGRFNVWAIRTVAEGVELLMEKKFGDVLQNQNPKTPFEAGTLNAIMVEKLWENAKKAREFYGGRTEYAGTKEDPS